MKRLGGAMAAGLEVYDVECSDAVRTEREAYVGSLKLHLVHQ